MGGEEDLLLVGGVAVSEEAVDEDQGLEGDRPTAGLGEATGQTGDALADVVAGVAGEAEYLSDVPLLGRVLVVACGLDDGHVEVGDGVAAADLGQADAGLVLNRAHHLSDLAGCHISASCPAVYDVSAIVIMEDKSLRDEERRGKREERGVS